MHCILFIHSSIDGHFVQLLPAESLWPCPARPLLFLPLWSFTTLILSDKVSILLIFLSLLPECKHHEGRCSGLFSSSCIPRAKCPAESTCSVNLSCFKE